MSSDVKEAAAYLRKPDADQCALTRRGMMERLAMAYLAEHPADDAEPVTLDRLTDRGFVEAANPAFIWHPLPLGSLAVNVKGLSLWLVCDLDDSEARVPAPRTMGDLRRLLAALGVT